MPTSTDQNPEVQRQVEGVIENNKNDIVDNVNSSNNIVNNDPDVTATSVTDTITNSGSSSPLFNEMMSSSTNTSTTPSLLSSSSIDNNNNTENPSSVSQKSSHPKAIKPAVAVLRRKTRNSTKTIVNNDSKDTSIPAASSTNTNVIPSTIGNAGNNTLNTDVTQENIADRYLEFILYCNPSAPSDLDVSSLIRSFNAVPKSDGKTFETWVLFQLVSKHNSGEIKTWTKLAQQLGVERTNESSPQKIQQYAVRLKKWMRSIHIDAFFDFILSKPNEYYDEPHKNPTGLEPSNGADDSDETDLVLKLIKRASSKQGSDDDLLDEDERDAWDDSADLMQIDDVSTTARNTPTTPTKNSGSLRRKSVVQFASARENIPKIGKPKNNNISHHIPTPNPSPTTMPDMKLHHHTTTGMSDTGHFRVISNQRGGPSSVPASDLTNINMNNKDADNFSFSELLLPPTKVPSDPNDTIKILQQRLVKAVGMLEDSQRKIDMYENVVRQREEEIRKRVARGFKDEIIS
ncbi:5375_t:CDS:10 [Diversispora eburnea]|uniref:5375_t:CDS:1 n=1 Tax=Diversispora eburnea TaxID=1213867 RepID=A0A9N9ATQ2_9GLOM|nr:5375_t:CDS:10 [Diversispora eburnea]